MVVAECTHFDTLSEEAQALYKFPSHKLSPLRFYWESNFRRRMQQYLDGKNLKQRDMLAFKKAIKDKLEQLNNQKNTGIAEIKT